MHGAHTCVCLAHAVKLQTAASAAGHKSSRIMLAAVKFFLGQDKVCAGL